MKLRIIAEHDMRGSRTVIRDAADAFGDLIQYIYTLDDQEMERRTLDAFLAEPTPENWERSSWLLDSAIEKSGEPEETLVKWAGLKTLTSPVIASALYDIDSRYTRGTPLQGISLTSKKQKDLKAALGPQGYVGGLSELGNMRATEINDLLSNTADEKDTLDNSIEQDLPNNVRKIEKF